MNRREKLITSVIGPDMDETKAKMLDATLKLILGDMGQVYSKFWEAEGPGVLCFQPDQVERSVFYLTLKELHAAQEECERDNNGDLAETFRRILQAAQKIDPEEKAGYILNDKEGIRFLEIDYNKVSED
ncbi:MAG: hypothetical protein ACO390_17165 [bacterium]